MNKRQMLQMLELSSLAYRDNQPLCHCTSMTVLRERTSDTECFVRVRGDFISIVFRGTDSLINWKNDFRFCKRVIPYDNEKTDIRVHAGFLETYRAIRPRIHTLIPPGACRVMVSGHSLGAALAVLCAVDIQYNFPHKDVEVYLFGCPRVGNRAFARSYNKRVFKTLRVTNGNDIVTKVPPALWGFRHVGIDIHVGAPRLPFVVSLGAHRPQRYYKALWWRCG